MGPHQNDATPNDNPPSSLLTANDLEKVRARDPEALGRLFDAYFGRLYSLAYRLMGNEAAAQDIVQELFLRVHKAAHQLDVTRDPAPWLLTITTNLCREKWRSRQGRQDKQTLSLDAKPEYTENVAATIATPEQDAIVADQGRLLAEALDQLPEPMRLVVVLHDMQGLNHEEIAEMLQEAAPAVRKRYSRALLKLRELLQDHKPDVLE
ncbi:MAG: sigma-70 family RNA polymerase sigma factor [Candidatus Krumholzibacteria bacterium]|nr:sigma-70 family RNA polymerase sigma factor [Candidatus Krumholzibacteria bacterium]